MSIPPPAAPTHLLRLHSHAISATAFSDDNERLYSGDASGFVVVTSTRSLRPIAKWQAHEDGLLGIEEWETEVLTHGRDNKLHVWQRTAELPESGRLGDTAANLDLPEPQLSYSMDVNALNYCRFSLMPLQLGTEDKKALVALPGLIDSSVADLWSLPARDRIHAAIGQEIQKSIFSMDPKSRNNAGIIMDLHLFTTQKNDGTQRDELYLLCAYENGSVALRRYACEKPTSVEGRGWETLWTSKLHAETIMAMKVSRQDSFAISVSADNLVCRYDISRAITSLEDAFVAHKTRHPGNGSIAIRDDGKVCAIGGWDGSVRLYSTKTMKPLGTLKYHKSSCQVVAFARSSPDGHRATAPPDGEGESDDEITHEEIAERERWLVAGSKDSRVSIWSLISFSK